MAGMQESPLVAVPAPHEISGARASDPPTRACVKASKMSVYEITPRPLPLGTITAHRVVTAFEHLLTHLAALRNARRTEAVLGELTDAQLADIGLHRGQIHQVAGTLAGL
jgi:uncharacterized protein YjiS (DUF1127 family)